MKERPIIFSAAMVRAILDGHKTQTRRVVKYPQWASDIWSVTRVQDYPDGTMRPILGDFEEPNAASVRCPYGKPGDWLWVRESWRTVKQLDKANAAEMARQCDEANYRRPWAPILYGDGVAVNWIFDEDLSEIGRLRHARFMPRWASRITLEITDVRVHRLQEISEGDAIAEGVEQVTSIGPLRAMGWKDYHGGVGHLNPIESFRSLWNSIQIKDKNTKVGHLFIENPWVWALTFKRVEATGGAA